MQHSWEDVNASRFVNIFMPAVVFPPESNGIPRNPMKSHEIPRNPMESSDFESDGPLLALKNTFDSLKRNRFRRPVFQYRFSNKGFPIPVFQYRAMMKPVTDQAPDTMEKMETYCMMKPTAGMAPPPSPCANFDYRSVFEDLPEGVFTVDMGRRITSFNRSAERITGFGRAEVLGRHCWEIFRSDLCRRDCPLERAMRTGETRMDQDVIARDRGGRPHSLRVNVSVLQDELGRIVGAVETFRPPAHPRPRVPVGLSGGDNFAGIIGRSAAMRRLFEMLPDVAASDANVLIQGESGTGKDLLARSLHQLSPRRNAPFVAVNCAALAETLLESELFGHEKGAFTGADRARPGRFELAGEGTLFLDEIGELKPQLQVKLLRVIEERSFERVGGARSIPLNARIISATNQNLERALREGRFREDLYYRLRTVPMHLPPLRERLEDIPTLVDHFVSRFNHRSGKRVRSVDPKVLQRFSRYAWPGNVRELERCVEHAFVFVKGPVIFARYLPEMAGYQPSDAAPEKPAGAPKALDEKTLRWALSQAGGRRAEAAALLGISRTSLWRRMKQMGMV